MGFDLCSLAETGETDYFRLNNGGMRLYVDAMWKLGMVNDDPAPPWSPGDGEEAFRAVTAFDATHDGIRMDKLNSNDGWWVKPREIESALAAYDRHETSVVRDALRGAEIRNREHWDQWIDWLRLMAQHEGFSVW